MQHMIHMIQSEGFSFMIISSKHNPYQKGSERINSYWHHIGIVVPIVPSLRLRWRFCRWATLEAKPTVTVYRTSLEGLCGILFVTRVTGCDRMWQGGFLEGLKPQGERQRLKRSRLQLVRRDLECMLHASVAGPSRSSKFDQLSSDSTHTHTESSTWSTADPP